VSTLLRMSGVGKRYTGRAANGSWALRDLDLELAAGEVVSVIGRNGAGKSTLLKLATGVTQPTAGTVLRVDRVAPLIEVGAGFHPDLSGRDNVMVNGRLLGLSKAEVVAAFDEIVGFAELGDAIDRPVQTYSSGMFMRLAFSVAIHTRPQLLLVDEVLAVGDMPFQVRCLDRIRALRDDGVGVLFVSHNLAAVQDISDRCLLLERGRTLTEGPPAETVAAYHLSLAAPTEALELLSVELADPRGSAPQAFPPGGPATLRVRVRARRDTGPSIFGYAVSSEAAGLMQRWHNGEQQPCPALATGEVMELELGLTLGLGSGGYALDLALVSSDWTEVLLNRPAVVHFAVGHRSGGSGLVDLSPRLTATREPASELAPAPS
jgi:lipopolysaccharide transport system ATP-binding protein